MKTFAGTVLLVKKFNGLKEPNTVPLHEEQIMKLAVAIRDNSDWSPVADLASEMRLSEAATSLVRELHAVWHGGALIAG